MTPLFPLIVDSESLAPNAPITVTRNGGPPEYPHAKLIAITAPQSNSCPRLHVAIADDRTMSITAAGPTASASSNAALPALASQRFPCHWLLTLDDAPPSQMRSGDSISFRVAPDPSPSPFKVGRCRSFTGAATGATGELSMASGAKGAFRRLELEAPSIRLKNIDVPAEQPAAFEVDIDFDGRVPTVFRIDGKSGRSTWLIRRIVSYASKFKIFFEIYKALS